MKLTGTIVLLVAFWLYSYWLIGMSFANKAVLIVSLVYVGMVLWVKGSD